MEDNLDYEIKANKYNDDNDEVIDNNSLSSDSKSNESSTELSKDDNASVMTIELDNKFKHLSVKELKELCKESDLQLSGNKSKLIQRLLENVDDVENVKV